MKQSQRTVSNLVFSFISLCLFLSIAVPPVYAVSIKTQSARQIQQLGPATGTDKQGVSLPDLQLPSDVAVHKNKVYLVDGSNHRIVVYDLKGKFLFSFGKKGSKPGQFNYPVGIDAAMDNRIYVADSGNNRIQIFSDKGDFISSFSTSKKAKDSKGGRPIDVLLHSRSGKVFVTNNSHHLMIYTKKGKLLDTWGKNGTSRGEFRYPATLSELDDGRIAVVDVLNSRVQVFNTDGTLSTVVGEWGVLPGQLFRPKGIAIDKNGNFYISDSYMGVIQKYADDAIFEAVLGDNGEPYKLVTPVGMTVYKDKLFVVEMKNNRVLVFQLKN